MAPRTDPIEEYHGWNVKGIAESTLKSIRADGCEDVEDVLDDYLQDDYHSIESRDPQHAMTVMELVRDYIIDVLLPKED